MNLNPFFDSLGLCDISPPFREYMLKNSSLQNTPIPLLKSIWPVWSLNEYRDPKKCMGKTNKKLLKSLSESQEVHMYRLPMQCQNQEDEIS